MELHLIGSALERQWGYDLRVALDLSLRGSDWAPSIHEAPRIATHRPFRAGQAKAPIAASVSSDMSFL